MEVLIGADPEVFVKDKETGAFISAHGLIPGTKENPHPVPQGAVQVDGMALEFNINPAETSGYFNHNIATVFDHLKAMLKPEHEIVITPTAVFTKEYMASLPEEAKILGCDMDYNAWTGEANPAPDKNSLMRTAAGHIHIGWTKNEDPMDPVHFEDCRTVIKQLDYYLGIYSILWDKDTKRRDMYGQAGAFRPKSYGAEYRVLSNAWLANPGLIDWVYGAAMGAMRSLTNGVTFYDQYGERAKDIINYGIEGWVNGKPDIHGHMRADLPPGVEVPDAAPTVTTGVQEIRDIDIRPGAVNIAGRDGGMIVHDEGQVLDEERDRIRVPRNEDEAREIAHQELGAQRELAGGRWAEEWDRMRERHIRRNEED